MCARNCQLSLSMCIPQVRQCLGPPTLPKTSHGPKSSLDGPGTPWCSDEGCTCGFCSMRVGVHWYMWQWVILTLADSKPLHTSSYHPQTWHGKTSSYMLWWVLGTRIRLTYLVPVFVDTVDWLGCSAIHPMENNSGLQGRGTASACLEAPGSTHPIDSEKQTV